MRVAAATTAKVAQLKPANLIDTSLLDEIIASGFVTRLYDGNPPPR